MDGTFSVSPPQFTQLYTVHGLKDDHQVVCCYALLPNKRGETYVEFLRQVNRLSNGATPETIMIDFEQACITAIPRVFPHASVYGCHFHLCKSIYRHIQSEGLQERYIENEEFRTNMRYLRWLLYL